MNIMFLYQELLERLEHSYLKDEMDQTLQQIQKDENLLLKIKKYHMTHEEKLRKEIYANEIYRHYKKLENRVNLLILKCNHLLGELKNENS